MKIETVIKETTRMLERIDRALILRQIFLTLYQMVLL